MKYVTISQLELFPAVPSISRNSEGVAFPKLVVDFANSIIVNVVAIELFNWIPAPHCN